MKLSTLSLKSLLLVSIKLSAKEMAESSFADSMCCENAHEEIKIIIKRRNLSIISMIFY
jgi:hypothetical protein